MEFANIDSDIIDQALV